VHFCVIQVLLKIELYGPLNQPLSMLFVTGCEQMLSLWSLSPFQSWGPADFQPT